MKEWIFQLTASRRGWPKNAYSCTGYGYFNSQPHEEADAEDREADIPDLISTHSLTKRLTDEQVTYFDSLAFQLTASRRGWQLSVQKFLDNLGISTHSLTKRLTMKTDVLYRSLDISTHSLTKRLTELIFISMDTDAFQLTASRRGWHWWIQNQRNFIYFNSQPHEEADGFWWFSTDTKIIFQLTASRRGWRNSTLQSGQIDVFQLTASRRGWRKKEWQHGEIQCISTHSLTKRLTGGRKTPPWTRNISTHSLTKRLTAFWTTWQLDHRHFNSQPHEEADWGLENPVAADDISTHSLTKRLTEIAWTWLIMLSFQLTASRRGWPPGAVISPIVLNFNSQPHEEADDATTGAFITPDGFQLTASRRGWRSRKWGGTNEQNYFNSQPHEEADRTCEFRWTCAEYFNSQPHEEADGISFPGTLRPILFQLTASRRGWRHRLFYLWLWAFISTHSLTKRLTQHHSQHLPHQRLFQLTASRRGWQPDQ